ncbi:MAG: tRNA lysidine(34) synthetase TilS [Bacteroidales bacterium]|nr:tRNA lysidine(34) synthetase TilS [Bacteroidales bacterium]
MTRLLAVSGGIDSMFLLERSFREGGDFAVAHCNFQLRGAESDEDEAFVRAWCGQRQVRCFTRRFETAEKARREGISLEMAARSLRYDWFAALCRTAGFGAVVTAHNADDNAETLLLHLLRGCGSRGWRGMAAESTVPGHPDIRLLRPLLGWERADIRAWMEAEGCRWREDSSNGDEHFLRNKLRHQVLPVFRELNPAFVRTLNADMAHLAQADDIADAYFQSVKPALVQADGIPVHALLALAHWPYVLWRLVEDCRLNPETFDKLLALLQKYRTAPRGTVTLGSKQFQSPTHLLYFKRKKLIISKVP